MYILKALLAFAAFAIAAPSLAQTEAPASKHDLDDEPQWSIAIHGGAGTMDKDKMTSEQQAEYKAALQNALDAGAAVLKNGGTAVEAVKAAIVPLEDDPKFNAGRGSVFTWEGANEMDASIMDGATREAGAVTGVRTIRNPILLADAVMKDGRHVFLSGKGAEQFAFGKGLERADPEWFATERRKKALERMKAKQLSATDVDGKFGTVGAVVLDMHGNLAAGTSTGGMTGKRWGRIGDSPVIGAGNYADNRSCAVSATGSGEYFIRVGVAQSLCSRLMVMNLLNPGIIDMLKTGKIKDETDLDAAVERTEDDAQRAADAVMREVEELGGSGGVILVTPEGYALFSFNTPGMYRGRASSEGVNEVAIFADE